MKRKLLLFSAVLLLSSLTVSAQELYSKIGAIPQETVFAGSIPSEPDASAVLLKEEIVTRFVFKNDTFLYETDHFVRIKILKEEGLKYHTCVTIVSLQQESGTGKRNLCSVYIGMAKSMWKVHFKEKS